MSISLCRASGCVELLASESQIWLSNSMAKRTSVCGVLVPDFYSSETVCRQGCVWYSDWPN